MKVKFKEKLGLFAALIVITCGAAYFSLAKLNSSNSKSQLDKSVNSYGNGFETVTLGGERFTLSTLSGKPVIIHFWASWCGPCVNEFPKMIRFIKSFKGEIHLVALSADQSDDDIKAFLKKTGFTQAPFIQIIRDVDERIAKQYLAKMLPTSVILGKELRTQKRFSGEVDWEDPELRTIFEKLIADQSPLKQKQ